MLVEAVHAALVTCIPGTPAFVGPNAHSEGNRRVVFRNAQVNLANGLTSASGHGERAWLYFTAQSGYPSTRTLTGL